MSWLSDRLGIHINVPEQVGKIPIVGPIVKPVMKLIEDTTQQGFVDLPKGIASGNFSDFNQRWQPVGKDIMGSIPAALAALAYIYGGPAGSAISSYFGGGAGAAAGTGAMAAESTPWLLSAGEAAGAGATAGEALTPALIGEAAAPALTYGSTGIGVGSGIGVSEGALAGASALGGATAGATASPLMYGDTGIGVGSGVGVGDVTPATLPEATVPLAPAESLPAASPVGAGGGDIYNFNAASENQPGGTVWPEDNSMLGSAVDWMKNNKALTAMIGMNALGGLNKSSMAGDLNAAQQKSYSDYLSTINPPDSVKASRYQAGVGEVGKESSRLRKTVSDNLASRGIRGKGAAAPTGDVEELDRQARNKVYNQIYGTYNVPNTPGPANYAPTALQATMGDMQSISNYLLPFILAGKI